MHLVTVQRRPIAVINGKDFAVYRWFAPANHGPLFIQVAGRTALTREDLPTDDWLVLRGRDRGHRLATAWRKPWFDHRVDAARKLAFVGGSTSGAFYLALRYVVRRFGLDLSDGDLIPRSVALAERAGTPRPHVMGRFADLGVSGFDLVTLEVPTYWSEEDAEEFLRA